MIVPEAGGSSSTGIYRLRRGSKASELPPLPPHPPVPELSSLDGPFQLAEYLALKIRHDPHDVKGLVDVPAGDESEGGKGPDRDVWIYEHLRRIPIDLTPLVNSLLTSCSRRSCAQMKADEWLYLCVAHGGNAIEECCAIDYILHTLDSTTTLLNSTKNFPSRLSIPTASTSHFPSLFRRLSRIFSHAYYHHREAFQLAEAETSLYARFVGLCEKYGLVGSGLLVIPREAIQNFDNAEEEREAEPEPEGEEEESEEESEEGEDGDVDGDEVVERGRESETTGKQDRRPHSLGRHPDPEGLPSLTAGNLLKSTSPIANTATTLPTNSSPTITLSPSTSNKSPHSSTSLSPSRSYLSNSNTSGKDQQSPDTKQKLWQQQPQTAQKIISNETGTLSRGTLSKGKSPRGTMLWSSDSGGGPAEPTVTPVSAASTTNKSSDSSSGSEPRPDFGINEKFGAELTRSDSVVTAIHVGEENTESSSERGLEKEEEEEKQENSILNDDDQAQELDHPEVDGQMEKEIHDRLAAEEEEEKARAEEVPKDEIDLLEERGTLPLSPGATGSEKQRFGESPLELSDGLHSLTLDERKVVEGEPEESEEDNGATASVTAESIISGLKQSVDGSLVGKTSEPSESTSADVAERVEEDQTSSPEHMKSEPALEVKPEQQDVKEDSSTVSGVTNIPTANVPSSNHAKKGRNRGKKGRAGSGGLPNSTSSSGTGATGTGTATGTGNVNGNGNRNGDGDGVVKAEPSDES